MSRTVVSVSVDLDELSCYHAIHGLRDLPGRDSRAVWTVAVPRLVDFFDRLGVKATFFVVGSSMDDVVGRPAALDLDSLGHEVANHTQSHPYDLLSLGEEERRREIRRCSDAIEAATGRRPSGFRAPGYNVDDALIALLADEGFAYDSSVFPCTPYYGAKATVMATMRLRGRRSQSRLGPPQVLLAPTEPYRMKKAFWRRGREGLVELPVAVLPAVRAPFIGTSLVLAGPWAAAGMARAISRRKFVGLELHGIDVLDGHDDDVAPLAPYQPDVRVPLQRKLEALEAAIRTLVDRGAELVTCREAASRVGR